MRETMRRGVLAFETVTVLLFLDASSMVLGKCTVREAWITVSLECSEFYGNNYEITLK